MSDTNNTNNKVLGLSALPHLKEYFAALCEHLIDNYYNAQLKKLIEDYNFLLKVIESLHGELDSFRIENELFGIIEPECETEKEKYKLTKIK
jgi:hypothetical protein